MSIPAGMLLERFGQKPVLVSALRARVRGLVPLRHASRPIAVALVSLFTIGIGMTMLQVAINPLLRVAGGEEHFAFFSVMAQLVFGSASFLSPYVYSYLVTRLQGYAGGGDVLVDALAGVVPPTLPWVSLYWVFTVVTAVMVVVLALGPAAQGRAHGRGAAGGLGDAPRSCFGKRVRAGCSSSASSPTSAPSRGSPTGSRSSCRSTTASTRRWRAPRVVSHFWGLMTAGCLLGLVLLKLFDCRRVLVAFSVAAMVSLAVGARPAPASISRHRLHGWSASACR